MFPKPSDGFAWVQVAGGRALVCEALAVPHLFTTRSWALGSAFEAERPAAWETVGRSLGADAGALCRAQQAHGASVIVRRMGEPPCGSQPLEQADIIISDDPSRVLAIQTADCVPLLVADRRTQVVAAAHAGWKGMAAGVPRKTIEALAREFGSRPSDLVVVAGPSVGACCYEVGVEVRDAFAQGGFTEALLQRWFFDGWAATRHQLEEAGIPASQIHSAELCTASHPGVLCSYRRHGKAAGRIAAAIRKPKPKS